MSKDKVKSSAEAMGPPGQQFQNTDCRNDTDKWKTEDNVYMKVDPWGTPRLATILSGPTQGPKW